MCIVEVRRRALETKRQTRIQEMAERRRQRASEFELRQQEKEKERVEAARAKERDREERLAALNKQQKAHIEELQKKIQQKVNMECRVLSASVYIVNSFVFSLFVQIFLTFNVVFARWVIWPLLLSLLNCCQSTCLQHYNTVSTVSSLSRSIHFYTRALRHIRPALTESMAASLGASLVQSRLDYANSIMYGMSASNIHKLQSAQNSLTRVVLPSLRRLSASELLSYLHWLPIHY